MPKWGKTALDRGKSIHCAVYLELGEAVFQTSYILYIVEGAYSVKPV